MPRRCNTTMSRIKNLGHYALKSSKRKANLAQRSRQIRPSQRSSKENGSLTSNTASETSNSTGSSIQTTSTEPLSPTKVARSLKSAQSVRDSVAETSFQTTDEYEITAGLVPWKSVPVQEVDKRGGNIPSTSNPKALLPSVLPFSPTRLDKTLAHARSVRAAVHKTGFKSTEEYEKEIGWAPLQVSWKRARLIDHQKNMTLQHGSFQPQKTWKFVQEHTS